MTKKKTNDATAFKRCESEPIFAFVKDQKTEKIKICVGGYVVSSKEFESYEDAEKFVKSKPYELLINTSVLFSKINENENSKETANDAESSK